MIKDILRARVSMCVASGFVLDFVFVLECRLVVFNPHLRWLLNFIKVGM